MGTSMDTKRFVSGFLSLLFAFTQAVPSFAADTLRNMTAENPATTSGLEERLQAAPSVGPEEREVFKEIRESSLGLQMGLGFPAQPLQRQAGRIGRRAAIGLLGSAALAAGGAAVWRQRSAARQRQLKRQILQAVDATIAAHRSVLSPEDLKALESFKRAFRHNPAPFDVWGLLDGTIPPALRPKGKERHGVFPIVAGTNYRLRPDGSFGRIDAAVDSSIAVMYLEAMKRDVKVRDLFASLLIREGANVQTLQDPDVVFTKERLLRSWGSAGGLGRYFTKEELEEGARALEERRRDAIAASPSAHFLKQMAAVNVQIAYPGHRRLYLFLARLGYDGKKILDLAERSGLQQLPSVAPFPKLLDERSIKVSLLFQQEGANLPHVRGVRLFEEIEGSLDFLSDPVFYEPKALRKTIEQLEKRASDQKRKAGLEETPITEADAKEIVRGWRGLTPGQRKLVVKNLKKYGVTLERYKHLRSLVLGEEEPRTGTFVDFPEVLDGTPEGSDYDSLLSEGTKPEIRKRQGVVIAAAGEGTRLLRLAVDKGLLPLDGLTRYVKPTVPLTPVTGKSALEVQLETFAAEAKSYGVAPPIAVVTHEEARQRVEELLKEKENFGLKNLRVVVQAMNPALDKEDGGRIVLRGDGTVSFNPDGTGGVVRAALAPDLESWFRKILGPEGQIFLSNGDMLMDREMVQLVSGASAKSPFVGVAYTYPTEEDPQDSSQHKSKLGTFAIVKRGDEKRVEIVEYKERGDVKGLKEAVDQMEHTGRKHLVQANSGLYVFPLKGLAQRAARLTDHVQWRKDALEVEGKVEKLEYFATDLTGMHDPKDVKILSVEETILKPIKNPEALKEVRELAIQRERNRAKQLGFELSKKARVEFHPAVTQVTQGQDLVHVGENVRIEGKVGLYIDQDRVRLYTKPQPEKPWEPFDPTVFIDDFITQAGQPILIPDGTIFSSKGISTLPAKSNESQQAGLEETRQLIEELDRRLDRQEDMATFLTEDLIGLLNRIFPVPRPLDEFGSINRPNPSDIPRETLTIEGVRQALGSRGIVKLRLGDAFKHYGHGGPFDFMDNEQHVSAVLKGLQRIADMDNPNRRPRVIRELSSRGEERPQEQLINGVWEQTQQRVPIVKGGLSGALGSYEELGEIYRQLGPARKRDLWLAVLLHDIAKPLEAPVHDRIGADLVPELLENSGLPQEDIDLIVAVIRPHTLVGISYLREISKWEVAKEVLQIAEKLSPALQEDFLRMLLLLTIADTDAVGYKGKLVPAKVAFWLDFYKLLSSALSHGFPTPTLEELEAFGQERLRALTEPLPGQSHTPDQALRDAQELLGNQTKVFYRRVGQIRRLAYAYEPLRAMGNPNVVVRFFQVLLGLLDDPHLEYRINLADPSLGFRSVDRRRIAQVIQVLTDSDLQVDPTSGRAFSSLGELRVQDNLRNPEEPMIDVTFSPAIGLEEVRAGKKSDWVVRGQVLGKVQPIYQEGAIAGWVAYPNRQKVRLVSKWNPKINEPGYPRWQQPDPEKLFDQEELGRLRQTGQRFDDWKERATQPPTDLAGSSLVFLSNSLQSNFHSPWEFLIVDGQVVRQWYAKKEYPLDGQTIWTFVLEPGPPRLVALKFHGDEPEEKGIQHAIAGVPLIREGKDVSSEIQFSVRPGSDPLKPIQLPLEANQVPWDPHGIGGGQARKAPLSAMGVTSDGELFHLAIVQHITVRELAQILLKIGAHDAILLGGSNDVKQWIAGQGRKTLAPTEENEGTGNPGLDRPLNAILAGYAALPAFRYERVHALDAKTRAAIERFEQNMPDEMSIPVNLIWRFLEDEKSIIVVAKDPTTEKIVGYIFGVPRGLVYITEPPIERPPYKPRPIWQTFYEMSWRVLPDYQKSGIGTTLRKRFRNEVRQAGFAYLAFRQNDLYDEAQLKQELSERYRQGDQLFDLVRNLPSPPGTSTPQQFVVLSMNLPLSQRPTALPPDSGEVQAGLEETAPSLAAVTQTEGGRGPRTQTGILRESSFFTRTSNEVTPLRFFVDTREDSRTLRLAVLAAVVKSKEGWPIEFRGVARQEELNDALQTLAGDIGAQVILENRIATYESDADYLQKRAEALSQLPADVSIISFLTQEKLAWFDQALEAAGLKYASDELRRSVRAFLEAA